tara:strand:+ start:81 stop:1469 length:1389 start_codon:yes stop_codon:yes gene_type:complete
MTKTKFIQFIKDNRHKFVFFNYRGGMGGETICNHLTLSNDYFYNETLKQDIIDTKYNIFSAQLDEYSGALESASSDSLINAYEGANRSRHREWMFGDQFMLQSLYDEYNSNNNTLWDGKDNWLEHDTVHGWDAFYDKFFEISDSHHRESNHGDINCVFGWDNSAGDGKWEHEWKDVDHECDEILERFAAQDKPYLIRIHGITPLLKFFEGAKFIDIVANEWERYCTSLSEGKVFVNPIKGNKNIVDMVKQVVWCWSNGIEAIGVNPDNRPVDGVSPIKTCSEMEAKAMEAFVLDYIGDAEEIHLKTIKVIMVPDEYEIDLDSFENVTQLDTIVYTLQMFRSYPKLLPYFMSNELDKWDKGGPWGTKINEPNHKSGWWPAVYNNQRWWYDMIKPQLYNMQDMFDGDWVEEQFGMDPIPMRETMAEWHKNNCKFLDNMRITNYLPKEFSSEAHEIYLTHNILPK